MITIRGIDSDCLERIDEFVRDQRKITGDTYDVDLWEHVKLFYSYGDILLQDNCGQFAELDQMQYEDVSLT